MHKKESIEVIFEPDAYFTIHELSVMMGVRSSTVIANIKSIMNSGAVKPNYDGILIQHGKTLLPESYDLDMLIALAFRFDTPKADKIRRILIKKITTNPKQILLDYRSDTVVN